MKKQMHELKLVSTNDDGMKIYRCDDCEDADDFAFTPIIVNFSFEIEDSGIVHFFGEQTFEKEIETIPMEFFDWIYDNNSMLKDL